MVEVKIMSLETKLLRNKNEFFLSKPKGGTVKPGEHPAARLLCFEL
jgi:hypothetical protein